MNLATLVNFTLDQDHLRAFDPEKPRTNMATFDVRLGDVTLYSGRLIRYTALTDSGEQKHNYTINSYPRFVADDTGKNSVTRSVDGKDTSIKGNWVPGWTINDPYVIERIKEESLKKYTYLYNITKECGDIVTMIKEIQVTGTRSETPNQETEGEPIPF